MTPDVACAFFDRDQRRSGAWATGKNSTFGFGQWSSRPESGLPTGVVSTGPTPTIWTMTSLVARAALFVATMRAGMKLSEVFFGSRSGEAESPAAT
ncbi:hypothetical protein [uncultured Rhodoblastus sp.]|uniref:hypothetical protein n=1 Tax=uncultured Rhodoblastus sp. TaxID=543037 RepID=UPI0025E4E6E4|nr:hypothetical protein [uncultured Rhodoblastus sp.]